jgi:hypothetical protein
MENIFTSPATKEKDLSKQAYDLFSEKLLISRATTTEQFGSPNVYKAAEHLYAALYSPDKIDSLIIPNEKFPDRITVLKKAFAIPSQQIPSKEEFILKVRHAMVSEVNFGECVSAEARQAIFDVMSISEQTVIWTDGDAAGVPEHNLPGTREQLHKIAAAKVFNQMRQDIAAERGNDRRDVLSVVAVEGKMKFIPAIVHNFREKGINKIIIADDRAKNLLAALELIRQTDDMDTFPVWIRQGMYKNKLEGRTEEELQSLHPINSIGDLRRLLEENKVFENSKVGSIFDFDGVLSDDDKRKELQTKAVYDALKEKGWL